VVALGGFVSRGLSRAPRRPRRAAEEALPLFLENRKALRAPPAAPPPPVPGDGRIGARMELLGGASRIPDARACGRIVEHSPDEAIFVTGESSGHVPRHRSRCPGRLV
jgi:hypothetical protein